MKHRYRVCYVGNDSLEHRMVVRAESRREAVEEAKRRGAEFVVSVRMVSIAWLWMLLVVSVGLYVVRLSIAK